MQDPSFVTEEQREVLDTCMQCGFLDIYQSEI